VRQWLVKTRHCEKKTQYLQSVSSLLGDNYVCLPFIDSPSGSKMSPLQTSVMVVVVFSRRNAVDDAPFRASGTRTHVGLHHPLYLYIHLEHSTSGIHMVS
jgi:hypothetical protein